MERSNRNKPKMSNGYSQNNEQLNHSGPSTLQNADLKDHITQISKVQGPHRQTVFLPLKGPGREELDRCQSRRKAPTPRNLKLYDDDSSEGGSSANVSYTSEELDENELRATVASGSAGKAFSNRRIEQRWANRQPKATISAPRASHEETKENASKKREASETMFPRLVAMRSLVQNRAGVDNDAALNFKKQPENVGENSRGFELVPDAIEPEFLRREIRNKRPDEDFIVEHVGRVTTVTARQFLIDLDPEDFTFQRIK